MDAIIRLRADEFDENVFQHIKNLLDPKKNLEVTISISEESPGVLRHETREEYFDRIMQARERLSKNSSSVSYTADQLDEFEKSLLNEP